MASDFTVTWQFSQREQGPAKIFGPKSLVESWLISTLDN
jgi:hypothetical protein